MKQKKKKKNTNKIRTDRRAKRKKKGRERQKTKRTKQENYAINWKMKEKKKIQVKCFSHLEPGFSGAAWPDIRHVRILNKND